MRLICGFFHLDGKPAEAARLEAMMSAQTSAGFAPWRESFVDGPIALGLLDFALPAGHAPLSRSESGLVIAADLRLSAAGESDQRRLLDDVGELGPGGLSLLAGDFAL